MKFVMFTIEGGPDHGKKITVNRDHVDCVIEHEGTTIIYFVGQKESKAEGWFNYVIVREDFHTVQSRLNIIAE